MAKIELKGKIVKVSEPVEMGEKGTLVQKITFLVPGWVDNFGDKKGQDEIWQFSVIGDNVKKFNITAFTHEGFKGKVVLYLNSNTLEAKAGREEIYIINAVLAAWELKV